MPKLKDCLTPDMAVFFNLDEFAEIHDIDGSKIPAVVDSDILKMRSYNKYEHFDGVYKGEIVVYVRASDFPDRPVFGQQMRLDGKLYLVVECSEDMGILEIVLGANES